MVTVHVLVSHDNICSCHGLHGCQTPAPIPLPEAVNHASPEMVMTREELKEKVLEHTKDVDIDLLFKGIRALHVVRLRNTSHESLVQELMEMFDESAKYMEREDGVEQLVDDQWWLMYEVKGRRWPT